MGLKGLAEAIILQSIEDLWDDRLKEDCVTFFKGKDFRACAEAAGLSVTAQVRLLHMVKDVIEYKNSKLSDIRTTQVSTGKGRSKWHKDVSVAHR
jgi:hypothetical protein